MHLLCTHCALTVHFLCLNCTVDAQTMHFNTPINTSLIVCRDEAGLQSLEGIHDKIFTELIPAVLQQTVQAVRREANDRHQVYQ